MSQIFNSTAPISVRETYGEFSQVDFLVQLKANAIQQNSFRINGKLKIFKEGFLPAILLTGSFLTPSRVCRPSSASPLSRLILLKRLKILPRSVAFVE